MIALQKGKKRLEIAQKCSVKQRILLTDFHYVPELYCNLFSLTCALANGATIWSDSLYLTVEKEAG
jgi:hypothetical protein